MQPEDLGGSRPRHHGAELPFQVRANGDDVLVVGVRALRAPQPDDALEQVGPAVPRTHDKAHYSKNRKKSQNSAVLNPNKSGPETAYKQGFKPSASLNLATPSSP